METQRAHTALLAIAVVLLLAGCQTPAPTPAPIPAALADSVLPSLSNALDTAAASRGRAIALAGCASCHAIDAAGPSPFAAATPFRDIVRKRSLDDLEAGFAQGLVTTHPAMPPYVFRASEIDNLIAYLETLKTSEAAYPTDQRQTKDPAI